MYIYMDSCLALFISLYISVHLCFVQTAVPESEDDEPAGQGDSDSESDSESDSDEEEGESDTVSNIISLSRTSLIV